MADIPAAPDEEWMPPATGRLFHLTFYYTTGESGADFWKHAAMRWSKAVDHDAEPTKALKAVVAGLIAPGDTDLDKAKKLYKAVQALDNTDFSPSKGGSGLKPLSSETADRSEVTWMQKSGSSNDIALLYLAMLRAAGLTAYAEEVVDRQRAVFDIDYLTLSQLDDTLVVLSTGRKEIELDSGEPMCPFGTLSWRHSEAGGISQSAGGRTFVTSSAQHYVDNQTCRIGDVTLDGRGGFTGNFRIEMTGQIALYWRQQAITSGEAEVKEHFDKSLESVLPVGVEAHVDHFAGLDDSDAVLVAFVTARGPIRDAASNRFDLPAFFFETRGMPAFLAQETRTQPIDMHYGEVVAEQVTYHLPDEYSVASAPRDARISWPQHANLTEKVVSAPGQITISRALASAFTFAKPEEYQNLRSFYLQVAGTDRQQLGLTRGEGGKGN